jgi:SAM-dependent methyltransferase
VEIDGLDRSPAMLERLRAKASALGLEPRVTAADMRDFTLPRRYDLVTIPFRSFMHLLSSDDQIRALRCVREHLLPGGRLVMNVFYPDFAIMAKRENVKQLQREFAHPAHGGPVSFSDLTRYDRVNQTVTVEREVVEIPPGADAVTRHYGFTLRWIFRFEMELLFAAAGFARWEVAGGYDGRPFDDGADEMVWTAWRE